MQRPLRSLPPADAAPRWDNRLVADIGFIRKRLRYPLRGYAVLPLIILALMAALMVTLMLVAPSARSRFPALGVLILFIVIFGKRTFDALRFRAVPTPFFSAENQVLLQRFLQEQHFAFARHPAAPEVFQIMSRSISILQDEREIVVFIADDRRILINSHFSDSMYRATMGRSHLRQIEGMLQRWLAAQQGGSRMPARAGF